MSSCKCLFLVSSIFELNLPTTARCNNMALSMKIAGQRLIYDIIDQRARDDHSRPYAAIPRTTNISDGFQDISWKVFANAINRCAAWMEARLGVSTSFQAVAYLGPLDLRYQILAVAAGKTGHAVSNLYRMRLDSS